MKKVLAVLAIVGLVSLGFGDLAYASNETLEKSITTNCAGIKAQIRRLRVSDANARVALGRSYDKISGELMASFNTRAEMNNQKNAVLIQVSGDFTKFVDFFRKSYVSYDNEVGRVLGVDCAAKPMEFYAGLEKLRLLRAGVRSNCDELLRLANKYRAEVERMKNGDRQVL